ncbi:MAG: hypothetical protein JXR37_32400 [Kiritimatiellae bacterium]|nr:hypothetical protein [Kiritimatiellia bacterium]
MLRFWRAGFHPGRFTRRFFDRLNGSGNFHADPLFVDPGAGDFRLRPGSPAIDAGTDVGLPYLGAAPDLGAIEFTPKSAPPAPPDGLELE